MESELKVIDKRMQETSTNMPHQESSFLMVIERLASNPNIDVEKLQRIMDMQEHVLNKNAEQAYNAAMTRTQAKIKIVPKKAKNQQTNSMYSLLEDIIIVNSPIYTAEGFSLSFYQGETTKPDHIRVMCDIMHEEGHTKIRYLDFPVDLAGIKGTTNKTLIHGEGSTFSYGRRYLTCLIFNIPTGDDIDGNNTQFITDTQAKEIDKIIKDKNVDIILFLQWAKVDDIKNIPSKNYNVCMARLKEAKGRPKTISCPEKDGKDMPLSNCDKCSLRKDCPSWE